MEEERLIEEAAAIIAAANRLVAFSGAGMSEESGIPTFRDPGGLWVWKVRSSPQAVVPDPGREKASR